MAAAIVPTVIELVEGMVRRDGISELTINYQSKGQHYALSFPRNAIADLLAGLLGMQPPASGQPIDIPAIVVQTIQPFQQDDGTTGLAVFLEGGWLLPLAIPLSALPSLQKTIADLELLARPISGAKQ